MFQSLSFSRSVRIIIFEDEDNIYFPFGKNIRSEFLWRQYIPKREQMIGSRCKFTTGITDLGFWEMKSTGAAMVIAAEGLTSFPGLEDCADLLMAA